MTEALATGPALERFLSGMDSGMLFEVMLEFESFGAFGALEFAKLTAFTVADEVPLKAVDVGEELAALRTRLSFRPKASSRSWGKSRGNRGAGGIRVLLHGGTTLRQRFSVVVLR